MSNINHNDKYSLVSQFLNGELSSEEEKRALHLIAEDNELRAMLRFDSFLLDSMK